MVLAGRVASAGVTRDNGPVRLHRAPAAPATPAYEVELGRVLRLAQEGLYWQGEVEGLLIGIRDGGDLADLARAGGPIISRYEAMRIELRTVHHPALHDQLAALDEIYAHHAMALNCALDLLAVSWRSERLREEQRRLGGLGSQGVRLADLTARLKRLHDGA
jgi:hypothetical protein